MSIFSVRLFTPGLQSSDTGLYAYELTWTRHKMDLNARPVHTKTY